MEIKKTALGVLLLLAVIALIVASPKEIFTKQSGSFAQLVLSDYQDISFNSIRVFEYFDRELVISGNEFLDMLEHIRTIELESTPLSTKGANDISIAVELTAKSGDEDSLFLSLIDARSIVVWDRGSKDDGKMYQVVGTLDFTVIIDAVEAYRSK